MPRVFLKRQDNDEAYELTDRATLGRHHDNDIVLHEDLISRHHCVFFLKDRNFYIKDLGSLNGLFLNGQPVHEAMLTDGDLLRAGAIEFRLAIEVPEDAGESVDAGFTSLILDPYFRNAILGVNVTSVQTPGESYFLQNNSVSTIGRMSLCDIPINNSFVSRNNTTIDIRDHRVLIADVSSTNGTFVNGRRIINAELKDGDRFTVAGEFEFEVRFEYDRSNSLDSLMSDQGLHTLDLSVDANKILDLYSRKFGGRVLLEVERQTLLMCDEFQKVAAFSSDGGVDAGEMCKFLNGISGARQIFLIDPVRSCSSDELDPRLSGLVNRSDPGMVTYFESEPPDSEGRSAANGMLFRSSGDCCLLLSGLKTENILYLLSLLDWFARVRLK